jgi:hypothetical protein
MFLTLLETLATTAFQTMAVVKNQVEVALPMKAYLVNMNFFPSSQHNTAERVNY